MKKNTATITFQNVENYGAILQVYALQKVINSLGFNNEVINYKSDYMVKPYGLAALKLKGLIRYILGIAYYIVRLLRRPKFNKFREKINFTECINKNQLSDLDERFDAFIAGSDQVWNDEITNMDESYFFDFVKNITKKHTYAASFGFENIPEKHKDKYIELASSFQTFNMREASGVDIIKSLIGKNANLVLDPTLLLTQKEWNDISIEPVKTDKYILIYQITVSPLLIKTANKIAKVTGYKIVSIPFPLGGILNARINLTIGPEEWIGLFKNAEIIITDSFHGCCFSVLYNKNFRVCITGAATRIHNLLKQFHLEKNLIRAEDNINIENKTNWNHVNKILDLEIKRCKSIIYDMLNT